MRFVRFSVANLRHATPGRPGLFNIARDARADLSWSEAEATTLDEAIFWFHRELAPPPVLVDGPPARESRLRSWFKETATEHIERARTLAEILTARGIQIREEWCSNPGVAFYEDEFQIVVEAEPEADLPPNKVLQRTGE